MVDYDRETALLVVDVQHDFAHPSGSLFVQDAPEVIKHVNREIERARAAGSLVVYSQDWHPESTPHFQKDGGVWPVHCVHDTWGAAFHEDLLLNGHSIKKGVGGEDGYSAFSVRDPVTGETGETELGALLHKHGIQKLVIVGIATDYCVVETALDAVRYGFKPTVLSDAVAGVDLQPGDSERAFARMREAGAVVV